MRARYLVRLTPEQRRLCEASLKSEQGSALTIRRARVLLLADLGAADRPRTDREIAEAAAIDARTVRRVRAMFAQQGFDAALNGVRQRPRRCTKLSATQEERILMLASTPPPPGYPRWTVRTLAAELCRIEGMPVVSRELVRRTLKRLQDRTNNVAVLIAAQNLFVMAIGATLLRWT